MVAKPTAGTSCNDALVLEVELKVGAGKAQDGEAIKSRELRHTFTAIMLDSRNYNTDSLDKTKSRRQSKERRRFGKYLILSKNQQ